MSSRNMSLLPRATLHSDSELFIYNWMLEDDPDLDWGNQKEAIRTRGKVDNPVSRARSRSAKKAQGTKGIVMQTKSWCGFMQTNLSVVLDQVRQKRLRWQRALLCKTSRDVDSRKLTLSVVLDQGPAKKAQETKRALYANRTDIYGNWISSL